MKTSICKTVRLTLIISVVLLFFTSCQKTLSTATPDKSVPDESVKALKFKDIKTSASFDWKLNQTVTLNVLGTPSSAKVEKSLFVCSEDGSQVFLTVLLDAETDYTTTLTIPSKVLKVKIIYGSISKTTDIVDKTISFDYSNNFLTN